VVTALPPDVKLIRRGGAGYWLEVTPPVAARPAIAPGNRPVPGQPLFVSPAETTGYQGVPAPPAAITRTA